MIKARLASFQYWPHLVTITILLLAYGGYRYFAYYYTWSNDAYVSAHIINMAAVVEGPISHIYVLENQAVKKGEKLVDIDSRPYQYKMEKALAALKTARLNYENEKLALLIAKEELEQIQSLMALSKKNYQRYQQLLKNGSLPEIQMIQIETKIKAQEAKVVAAVQKVRINEQQLDSNRVLAAEANYRYARYLYENTTIKAPANGYISNFNLRQGQYIKMGEGLFALVETGNWWVVTRYRETAIRLIKPGDKVNIKLDMYPGKVFHGHVNSIGWGINREQAGNVAPSTLTYLEATENWIKIAQRFPVRIDFDDLSSDYPLRVGASATTRTYPKKGG